MSDRGAYLLRTYGITEEQYDEMLAHQGGKCAICGKTPRTRRLNVDHDHLTGEVRGLLCSRCNQALGRFEFKDEVLDSLIAYVWRIKDRRLLWRHNRRLLQ